MLQCKRGPNFCIAKHRFFYKDSAPQNVASSQHFSTTEKLHYSARVLHRGKCLLVCQNSASPNPAETLQRKFCNTKKVLRRSRLGLVRRSRRCSLWNAPTCLASTPLAGFLPFARGSTRWATAAQTSTQINPSSPAHTDTTSAPVSTWLIHGHQGWYLGSFLTKI